MFTLGPLGTNAYLLMDKSRSRAVVIDPGADPGPLLKAIEPLHVEAILLTHTHFDHIAGVDEVRSLKKCPVYVHALEADWLSDPELNGSSRWPEVGGAVKTGPAEHLIQEEGELELLGAKFRVLHTPGHSPGSVSYLYGSHLFSGDVLFRQSVGRTDLFGGSSKELFASIQDKLLPLPPETIVYPGHGPTTTLAKERQDNPYF